MQDPKHQYISWESTREMDERLEREQEERSRLVGAVEGLSRTKDGLHFLAWLLSITGFLDDVPPTNEILMAHYQGRRTIGRPLFQLMKQAHCIEDVCREDILNG